MGKLRVLTSAAVLALGASACSINLSAEQWVGTEKKSFAVSGKPEISLKTFDGSIEIQAWDKPDVAIDVEKRGATKEAVEGLTVTSTQDGNRIELEVKRPRAESFSGFGLHQSASARLIVSVPREVNIVARTGDGAITVERVNGKLELRTGDGSIRASDVAGELTLDTGDGSVTVDGARGRIAVDTGDGGVKLTRALATVYESSSYAG